MKHLLLFVAFLAIFAPQFSAAQDSPPLLSKPITWAGNNFLVMVNGGGDTLSDSMLVQANTFAPFHDYTLDYRAKATDSSSSSVVLLVETKSCVTPRTSTGCDSLWTLAGQHNFHGAVGFTDSLVLVSPHATFTTNATSAFAIRHVQWMRFRAHILSVASGKTWTLNGPRIMGGP